MALETSAINPEDLQVKRRCAEKVVWPPPVTIAAVRPSDLP
jgi:hypothetical protein